MKKSKLVSCMFSVIISVVSDVACSSGMKLDDSRGALDYRKLEKVMEQRQEFSLLDQTQSFRVTFENGNVYYLTSSIMVSRSAKPVTRGYPGGRGWCEFDFFNTRYDLVNGIRARIIDHEDTNVCNSIEGISAVKYRNQPALLTVVQYHRGIDPAKTISEIGNNYHKFATLLVLTPHEDGSLSIRQDDACLGPMNQISELAVAKKRIAECNQ